MTGKDINPEALERIYGRSLLITREWSTEELEALLAVATHLEKLDRMGRRVPLLPNQLAYALFFDQSTRTKSAWAGAASRLGMQPVIVDGSSTQVSHGETAVETGAMLGMNAHAMGVRHDLILGEGNSFMRDMKTGIDEYLAASNSERKVPIVNLQCDIDHPTQTLADLLWLRDRFSGSLEGKKIALTWAYAPSYAKPLSVTQGLSMLLTRYGAEVVLAHPEGYKLTDDAMETARRHSEASKGSFKIVDSMDEAFENAHAVYPKSWGPYDLMLERVDANRRGDNAQMADIEKRALQRNAKYEDWICDESKMAKTAGGEALYMHCLPASIGAEVTPKIMEKFRFEVAKEAQKKVYVIMAMLAVAKVPDLARRLAELN